MTKYTRASNILADWNSVKTSEAIETEEQYKTLVDEIKGLVEGTGDDAALVLSKADLDQLTLFMKDCPSKVRLECWAMFQNGPVLENFFRLHRRVQDLVLDAHAELDTAGLIERVVELDDVEVDVSAL
jgi:hypothetical protein